MTLRDNVRSLLSRGSSSLLLPRAAARQASAPWPKCAVCLRNVDAYGIERDTPKVIEIWARCDGIREGGGPRLHAPQRGGFRIDKSRYILGITPNEFTDIVSRLTLKPGGLGTWVLDRQAGGDNLRPA